MRGDFMSWEFGSRLHRLSHTTLPADSAPFVVPDKLRIVLEEKEEVLRTNAEDAPVWLAECLLQPLILMLDQVAACPEAPEAMKRLVGLDDLLDAERFHEVHDRLLALGNDSTTLS